MLKQAVNL